jgi:hypothetical protein
MHLQNFTQKHAISPKLPPFPTLSRPSSRATRASLASFAGFNQQFPDFTPLEACPVSEHLV